MKKKLLTLGIFSLGFLGVFGQKIHTPAEIFKIMEESSIKYEIKVLEKEIPPKDRSDNLNLNHYYRITDEGQITTYTYDIDSNVNTYLTKAEDYFHVKKFSLAREMYLEALKVTQNFMR